MTRPGAAKAKRVLIASAFRFLLEIPLGLLRYRVVYGGRGSAKSWQVARALLLLGAQQPLRILCAREFQTSIADSVHALLQNQAIAMGLGATNSKAVWAAGGAFYLVQKTSIIGRNGTVFFFKGLRRNVQEIKSTEGIDICWVEEAEAVAEESWRVLTPTVRKPGSEIWVSFNPALPDDATWVRFGENPPARSEVRFVSWRDNPFITPELLEERADLLERDPEAEAHVWGGEVWTRSDAQVLNGKWQVDTFEPGADWGAPLFGLDFGFSQTPAALAKLWIHDERLMLEYAPTGIQWDTDEMERQVRAVPGADAHTILADAARPETINELRKRKLRVRAARKWDGSVKDGIHHLRSYREIVIHARCSTAIQQARLWRFKTDARSGLVLPDLQKGNDDVWDATRYALDPLIKQVRKVGAWFPGMTDPDDDDPGEAAA